MKNAHNVSLKIIVTIGFKKETSRRFVPPDKSVTAMREEVWAGLYIFSMISVHRTIRVVKCRE
jgi:hypothetical protein